VPSLLEALLDSPGLQLHGGLRAVFCGGEALPRELLQRFRESAGDDSPCPELVNLYGPTEVTIDATFQRCDASCGAALAAHPSVSIGRPIRGLRAYVMDLALGWSLPGAVGELFLAGAGLANGYCRRPALTAASFLPDPTASVPGARMYRSGDLVRLAPDGSLRFVGRRDFQVKVRGSRIEPGEVEAALLELPAVQEAVVTARPGHDGDVRLVAYWVATELGEPLAAGTPRPAASTLRSALARRLPSYMIPSAWVELDALPRTAHGKLDRSALPDPEWRDAEARYEAPRGPAEAVLAGIWTAVLGAERVGRDDDFFALGGHSLLATQAVSRIESSFGAAVSLFEFFESPTVRQLARLVESQGAESRGATGSRPPITPRPRAADGVTVMPLSFAQERLWFLDQLESGTAFYNITLTLRLTGALEVALFHRALQRAVDRHESLRTTFASRDGRPVQVIAPRRRQLLPVVDLCALPAAIDAIELADRLALAQISRPFDLEHGPLLRVLLLRLGESEHVITLSIHHIVSDGWSQLVLWREVVDGYARLLRGDERAADPLALQYADYAAWQRDWLQGEVLEAQLAYWRGKLTGLPGLELPTDRPRPAVESFRGALLPVELDAALRAGVGQLARTHGATDFMVLAAAFSALMGRYCGQSDIGVGTPIANRIREELEPLVGFFANTVVLRAELGGRPAGSDLVAQLRETTLGAYAHQELPFEKLVEELQPQRDMSRNPLFQVMLVLQNQPGGATETVAGLTTEGWRNDPGIAKFDLTLFLWPDGPRLGGLWEYNTDLFDPSTARRIARHFSTLLGGLVRDPQRPVAELPLLSAAERHQLAHEWSRGGTAVLAGALAELTPPGRRAGGDDAGLRPVHRWVEAQARRNPGAPAVVHGERRLSYGELEARANQLAHKLSALGVGPERLVGICVERSVEMVVAMLGVLKAGGAGVALDPAYPQDRLTYIIQDADLSVLLVDEANEPRLPAHAGVNLRLDPSWSELAALPATAPSVPVALDNPVYAIYTSGSTGEPKGIVVHHRAFANLMRWQLGSSSLAIGGQRRAPRTVQYATFGFCVSFQEMFSSWCAGGTLVLADEGVRRDIDGLAAFLEEEGIERLHLPFAALKHLADAAGSRELLPSRLREVITAGEQLQVSPAVRSMFERLGPQCSLHNQYGASETHVVSAFSLYGDPSSWPAIPPVGRPITEVEIYLLDERLEPVPIGVPGALYTAGDCEARGYLRDPRLTAEKLVPNPFCELPGDRLYRTGDLARTLPDGEILYLGRIDGQVKVRGYRVELGEVETALARHRQVRDVAVVAQDAGAVGVRLVAYVVPEARVPEGRVPQDGVPEAGGDRAELFSLLRADLKTTLPEHMVPSAFVAMDQLPLNANGKLDRERLPVPELSAQLEVAYVAPRTPAQQRLAEIWCEILQVERVGIHDGFFDLGGHSLLATQLVSRIRERFGVEVAVRRVFEAPTVEELAAELGDAADAGADAAPPTAIERRSEPGPAPLSYSQERLWFLDRVTPGATAFNMPTQVGLRGPLDAGLLARALDEVARRQGSLRTRFEQRDGRPVQVVEAEPAVRLPLVDLSALPEPLRRPLSERLGDRIAGAPFDLRRAPLVRTLLVRRTAQDHLFALCMHHIVTDGWSNGVLVQELGTIYAAWRASGLAADVALPALPIQYDDYAVWQRRRVEGELAQGQLAYWRRQLGGELPVVDLPFDRPRPAVQTFRGAWSTVRLSPQLTQAVGVLNRRTGATTFMTLLAAFNLLVARLAGQDEVLVGTPIAGRGRSEIERLIGFFLNTLVLRTDLSGDPSFEALVGRVRETALDAYAHQDVPFERLLEVLSPERDLSRTPLFQLFFNMVNLPKARWELSELTLEAAPQAEAEAKFDLTVYAHEDASGIGLQWLYNADLFDAVRVEEMVRQYVGLLEQAVAAPQRPIGQLSLRTQQAALLLPDPALWLHRSPPAPAWSDSVVARMHDEARRRPAAPAVEDPQVRWSYAELARISGWIAARLAAGGVRRGDRVVIYAHRSAPLAAAVFGVLEAGGAFVMLDPAYPPLRQAEIVEAAAPTAWVALAAAAKPPPELTAALDLLPACRIRWTLPAAAQLLAAVPDGVQAPAIRLTPDDAAVVGFTSGSTGRPKGIVGRHGSLTHFLPFQQERFSLTEDDRYAMLSGLAHDPLQRDLFTPLATGATLVIPDPTEIAIPGRMARWMARRRVTVAHLTPAMGQLICEPPLAAEEGRDGPAAIASLRWVLLVGDVLTQRDVARLRRIAPGVRCVNLFGSTETQRAVSFHVVDEAAPAAAGSAGKEVLPLGRGMRDAQLLVLDRLDRPAGVGEVGQLCTRSPHLALGYLDDPRRTAESFTPDACSPQPGERIYRTGDLGRYLPSGEAVYLGRADQQVKIRGFRIELGEIEAVLGGYPAVREAVVLAPADGPGGDRRLVAFVTLRQGGTAALSGAALSEAAAPEAAAPEVDGLREYLAARLPAYLVPAAFVALPQLPLTPNGKVARRALLQSAAAAARPAASAVAPTNDLEETIAAVWRQVLELPAVGIYDNFFDLGGHSLLLVRLHAGLQQAVGRELAMIDLFSHPTIHAQAEYLREADAGGRRELAAVGQRAERQRAALERRRARARGRR
jgi:amino acid adenylation domain-containing protein